MPIEGESTGCRQWNEIANLLWLPAERGTNQSTDGETVSALYRGRVTSFVIGLRDVVLSDDYRSQRHSRHDGYAQQRPVCLFMVCTLLLEV
jgi:hypothetical protein